MSLLLAGTIASVAGSALGGIAALQQGNFQSAIASSNAQQAKLNAAAQKEQYEREARRRIGTANAAYAASGVQMEGSPVEVLSDMAGQAALNALMIEFGGEQQAKDFNLQAAAAKQRGLSGLVGGFGQAAAFGVQGANTYNTLFGPAPTTGYISPMSPNARPVTNFGYS